MFTEITLQIIVIYALTGVFAGVMGGMLGLGGGIIIVPVLHFLFMRQGFPPEILMHLAVTTSLATIIVTSLASTYTHHKKEAVIWPVVNRFAPGILVGAGFGALLADSLSSNVLRIVFGVFETLVAIQIWFEFKPKASRTLPDTVGMVSTGTGIGLFSTLLGIGGGTLTVPFLLWCNVNIRNAVAVSSACGFPIAVAGTTSLIIAGWDNSLVPVHSLSYLYWPAGLIIVAMTVFFAPMGARLAHYLPVLTLKRIFSILLLIIGIRMLVQI
ncbi:MAG: sulfite exporter TauE/SafE family protein [Proteobacteria bacterium]|nr:sulfite exporter TauE/SafE family protein [Pseudomonadota bacterium]NOG61046.1 sulfite exporter TauE/SafE family protein [Pseudomonadota bacterium]